MSQFVFQTSSGEARTFDLCVFDCDGIIFDSNSLKVEAYRVSLRELGVPPAAIERYVELHLADVSVSRYVKFDKFFTTIYPVKDKESYIQKACDGYGRGCLELYAKLTPRPEALRLASSLAHTFVISGSAQDELRFVFKSHGISKHFNQIYGSPTTKVVHLEGIIKESGVEPDKILFIGDGYTDFKTSRHHGCHFAFLEEMSDWHKATEQMMGFEKMVTRCPKWIDLLDRIKIKGSKL